MGDQEKRPDRGAGGRNAPWRQVRRTFINDYEYVCGLGDLDECNGRECITPEFPGRNLCLMPDRAPAVNSPPAKGNPDASFTEVRFPSAGSALLLVADHLRRVVVRRWANPQSSRPALLTHLSTSIAFPTSEPVARLLHWFSENRTADG